MAAAVQAVSLPIRGDTTIPTAYFLEQRRLLQGADTLLTQLQAQLERCELNRIQLNTISSIGLTGLTNSTRQQAFLLANKPQLLQACPPPPKPKIPWWGKWVLIGATIGGYVLGSQ